MIGVIIFSIVKAFQAKAEEGPWTAGPYSYIRHPGYASITLMLLGFTFLTQYLPLLVFTVGTFIILWRASKREEEKLLGMFPEKYKEYKERISYRFIPYIL